LAAGALAVTVEKKTTAPSKSKSAKKNGTKSASKAGSKSATKTSAKSVPKAASKAGAKTSAKSSTTKSAPTAAAARKTPAKTTTSNTVSKKRGKKAPTQSWRARQQVPTPDRYKQIQEALAAKGYLKAAPSGVWNGESTDALRRFQADQKLDPSGKLNSLSLIALGLGPQRDTGSVPAPQAR
jgi:hypothetical protein